MFEYQNIDELDYFYDCYFYNENITIDADITTIVQLLTAVPKLSSLDKSDFSYTKHFEKAQRSYKQGLVKNFSSVDQTFILDKAFRTIFNFYVEKPLSDKEFNTAATLHKVFMGVENKFGEILEEYIASVLKEDGWLWCAGSLVKGIDLIKKDGESWKLLQIKSRSNTENSSSKNIREYIKDRTGAEITSWYRLNVNPKMGEDLMEWKKLEDLVDFKGFSDEGLILFFNAKYLKSKKIYCDINPLIKDLYLKKSLLVSLKRDIDKLSKAIKDRKIKTPRPLTQYWTKTANKYELSDIENIDSLLETLNLKKIEIIEQMIQIDQNIKDRL